MFLDWYDQHDQNVHVTKVIHRFNAIPVKIQATFLSELESRIQKFIWKQKRSQIDEDILKNRIQDDGITIPVLETYYRAVVIKTV